MSVFDLFRRFFEPGVRRDPFFGGITEDDDDEDDGYPFDQVPRHDFGFSFGHNHSPFHGAFGFEEFFRDFNELFADFGAITHGVPELPGIEPPLQKHDGSGAKSLRDSMLKYPDSHISREQDTNSKKPSTNSPKLPGITPWPRYRWEDNPGKIFQEDIKQDKDLDSEVSSQGLDTILRPSPPRSSSYFQSVSVSRITRPDGTVEERRTVRDGQGNITTTVTIQRGDEVLSSITHDGDRMEPTQGQAHAPLDFSDSQTVISRFWQQWFARDK